MALAFLIAMGQAGFSQQANIWYFGINAGLDFTGGPPVAITNGALVTDEGCASVCDNSGNLLFYTDGVKVWDAAHTHINPSTPLLGHASSTQSAVIIPKPGNPNRYFIFTQYQHGKPSIPCANGLNYTEVDVTGGVVTLVTGAININLLTCSETTEKITAACHSNGTDYWAVTVEQDGDFVSWPITSSGVGTAVYSFSMATPCNTSSGGGAYLDDRVGYMKISSQGTHLVLGRRQTTSINEAFTFNNSTGQVTSNLGTYHTGTVYGVEFSQDGNYFYTTEGFTNVVEYDIATLTPTTLFTASGNAVGALQMGPDGNIYVANGYEGVNNSNLDMISNVNSYPATYNDNYISLPSSPVATYSRLGLPDIVACFVPTQQGCDVEGHFNWVFDPAKCAVQFTDMSTFGSGTQIVSWLWKFGDGTSSTEQNPLHHYANPGNYLVCLTVTGYDGEECCVSEICMDISVEECQEDCNVDPDFNWDLDECENCLHNFHGFTHFTNREVIAWIWDFGDGNTALGQNPSHVYANPGVYMVCLTVIARNYADDQQCCVFKICHPVQVDCTGNPDGSNPPDNRTAPGSETGQAPSQTLKAYPNPASASLHIEYTVPSEQKVSVQMIDYTGKIIWQEAKTATKGMVKRDIDISSAPAGIYLIVVDGETFNLVEKIQVVKY